jgi:small subunit ribosomal protein S4
MGDPRKRHKLYSRPLKRWDATRIEEETELTKEFGLKTKKEIWKASSRLRKIYALAKKAISANTPQGEKEKMQFIKRLSTLGYVGNDAKVEDILNISLKDMLKRRLQSVVFTKGFARTMSQARQFIVHGHVTVNGTSVTIPSYIVPLALESTIGFKPGSSLASTDHPERAPLEKPKKKKRIAPKRDDRRGGQGQRRRRRPERRMGDKK